MSRLPIMGKQPDRMEGTWTSGSNCCGFIFQLCYFLVVELWASALASQGLSSSSVYCDRNKHLSFRIAVRAK